jgi:hypothetical protein
MKIDEKRFWTTNTYTGPYEVATLYERIQEYLNYSKAAKVMSMPIAGDLAAFDYFNILKSKKISTQDKTLSKQQKLEDDVRNLEKGMLNEDLTEEANVIFNQINIEAQIKFLQLYFDAYMAPKLSDNQWRLGTVTGTILESDFTEENNLHMIQAGAIYTRSQFAIPYTRQYIDAGIKKDKLEYFSTMYFPPYKIGPGKNIDDKTNFMKDILRVNPNATFDQDKFKIKKEGYTYREAGFKSINDYIAFLQWVAEGVTGVVSTYLTEWDLSVYMQEHLLTAVENGGPLKLYLNYRVRQDNPLADLSGNYTDDRALVFNVAGSAVSKIDFDCTKYWRPSDYPLSQWWTPYELNKDLILTPLFEEDEEQKIFISLYYLTIYDDTYSRFNYNNSPLKNIIRNQDYLGMVLGTWPDELNRYYQVFYCTDADAMTDYDVKVQGWIKKVAGADPGNYSGKTIDDFVNLAKEEMWLNGGYWGAPEPAGYGQGGILGRKSLGAMIAGGVGTTVSNSKYRAKASSGMSKMQDAGKKASNEANKGTGKALQEADLNQLSQSGGTTLGSNSQAQEMLNAGLDAKANASIMAKHTGINRFSPALFGGPHGASFSPNTIQAYFDPNNKFMRNIPRISVNNSNYFSSGNNDDYFTDVNQYYGNREKKGISPNKALSKLVLGTENFYIDYVNKRDWVSKIVEGTIQYRRNYYGWYWGHWHHSYWTIYDIPTHSEQGEPYNFVSGYQFSEVLNEYQTIPWTERNWWYNYHAYYHSYNNYYYRYWNWGWFYFVRTYKVYRLAYYWHTTIVPYKRYDFDDIPSAEWKIIEHNNIIETTSTVIPGFWSRTSSWWGSIWGWRRVVYTPARVVTTQTPRTDFVLRFTADENSGDYKPMEEDFINRIMKGKDNIPVIFFEGDGPDSIFQAKCSIKKYANITEVYKVYYYPGWWAWFRWHAPYSRTVLVETKYEWVKYIAVDLLNFDWFQDGLQEPVHTNRYFSGAETPVHLQSFINAQSKYLADPLMKFTQNYNDVMVGYKNSKTSAAGWVWRWRWWGWLNWAYWVSAPTSEITNEYANWISIGKMGMQGRGIITNIQGINPKVENFSVTSNVGVTYNLNFTDRAKLSQSAEYYPLKSIPYKMNNGTMEMPQRLKNALASLFTRALFFNEQGYQVDPGFFISIDVPFRNLLSILVTQTASLEFAQNICDNIDFEVLHQSLLTCVDRCVIKANGLTFEDERIQPDKLHVLYNYWTEQAINLFADKENHVQLRANLKTEFIRKINKFNICIKELSETCKKEITQWSYYDIVRCFNIVYSLKEECDVGLIEKFLFGYLNILYNYRFYFVAKRFNKENGTMWIMRALESVLDFIVPFVDEIPPPPLSKLAKNKKEQYKVAFYELQNTTAIKQEAIIKKLTLDDDRVKTVYVKVEWATEKAYEKWLDYQSNPNSKSEVPQVIEIFKNEYDVSGNKIGTIRKLAYKPVDGLYQFISTQLLTNDKNVAWNAKHIQQPQRLTRDIDIAIWNITWGDSPALTPIRWNVFGSVNVDNILEYSKASISPQEFVCLIEEGSDFWTVHIPQNLWPRAQGYLDGLRLRTYYPPEIIDENIKNDPYITMLGPMANTVYPITLEQERPVPGISAEVPDIYKQMNRFTGNYNE